ncbi:zf-HC2 domain-containing protein [Tessaracoccus antarcticus]|uniref:Mycothiol system anti-sigma-R factor n=1 Tax=Tessaracoccus antarcticus TaxID=2479848 RepID=A0A3M0G8X3_9ACTN|nr:zf-HC2 domain-containing protein [Tessaracoccus antarcticus]RMB58862.1 mycothiol system anti-sigma-R factor [Tessaracoccus antarcticus]
MSDTAMWSHEHDEMDECVRALEAVHAFLHHELADADADVIRVHLHACERCMENFDIESTITEMIERSQPAQRAPAGLAARVRVIRRTLR